MTLLTHIVAFLTGGLVAIVAMAVLVAGDGR